MFQHLPTLVAGAALILALVADRERVRLLRAHEDAIVAGERRLRETVRAMLAASRESAAAVRRALDEAVRDLAPTIDTVIFAERDEDTLRCVHVSGNRAAHFLGTRFSLERDDSPLTAAALCRHRVAEHRLPLIPGDQTFLAVPLTDGTAVIGVVYLSSPSAQPLNAEESIVTLVDLVVPAYRLARDREIDHERATIDALTGLLTPQAFRAQLAEAIARRAARETTQIALLFIDTDHFKPWNDAFGHASGDAVLRTLATIFANHATTTGREGIVGRNGGDEFCVAFIDTSKSEGVLRAEGIRRAVESTAFETLLDGRRPLRPITTSIGVAALPEDGHTGETLLEAADAAMYHSKRHGRNRVSFYDVKGSIVALEDERVKRGTLPSLPSEA